MRQYIITIPDNKVNSFIDMMKNITYVKNIEDYTEQEIPENHKMIVRDRIEKYKNKREKYLDWDDMEKNINTD